MRRQRDGFSLIEVIIAIAILAMVAMSLLSYFSSANRYANWGKTTQKADMAAQSVVEELASYTSFEQIENQVAVSGSAWQILSTPAPSNNKCQLKRAISVDNSDYMAKVTLNFDEYKATPAVPTTTPAAKFNNYSEPYMEEVYSENSVVLEETDQTATAVGDIFYQIYQNDKSITKQKIKNHLTRTMKLKILPYSEANEVYLVCANFHYEFNLGGASYSSEMPMKTIKIEKSMLKKIFLFYRPIRSDLSKETLDISADSSLPADFSLTDFSYYVVLQQDETITPPADYRLEIASDGNPAAVGLKNKVFDNVNQSPEGSDGFITHKETNRIASVTVEIFRADETDWKEENRLIVVETSKGA